jgi:hypothetical protein
MQTKRFLTAILLCCFSASSADIVPPDVRAALNQIQPNELKGDLSFLASDALQGRYTPSPGLQIAAEFIASKFRAAGLEPGGTDGYFQVAQMLERRAVSASSGLTVKTTSTNFTAPPASISLTSVNSAVHLADIPIIRFEKREPEVLKGVDLTGKAVVVPQPDLARTAQEDRRRVILALRAFDREVAHSKAAIEIVVTTQRLPPPGPPRLLFAGDAEAQVPVITVANQQLQAQLDAQSVSIDLPAPDDSKVAVSNVIGILRGSDPNLKDTCVLLTAHYDHIGTAETAGRTAMSAPAGEDKIFNGANDDGSGTVSVIEIARALSHLNPHPKRSIVFMTFFGEERGEFGSRYYGMHPVFPISKSVADVNLEQVGRTDSTTGKQIKTASLTGYDYSEVTSYLEKAGQQTGIKVYKDDQASDAYFTRSDNDALAEQGVPAHSLTVAFDYPDYHQVGDEWQKIDYDNMAAVDRMVALSLVNIANSLKAPSWNAENPKTSPFREAQENPVTEP